MRLIYHPEAEAEFLEAARHYEEEVAGLGVRFMTEWDRAIESHEMAPRGGRDPALHHGAVSLRHLLSN